jgi:hypothetical protein
MVLEIDWTQKRVIRTLKIPSAIIHRGDGIYIPSVATGMCNILTRVFIATWNFIVEIDYETFDIVNSFSHPYMADLHGMTTDGKNIWVASTAIDSVLCFDADHFDFKWRWGPDAPILWQERVFSGTCKSFIRKIPILRNFFFVKFEGDDFRIIHKTLSPYHYHHLNDVYFDKNRLYVTAKTWNRGGYGSVIQLDVVSFDAQFFIEPGTLKGTHDGFFRNGRFYITQCDDNAIACKDRSGKINSHKLKPSPYFIRGLCPMDSTFLVGFSRLRGTNHPTQIIEFDDKFERKISCFKVDNFYPGHIQTAIHAIIKSPASYE